MKFHNKIFIPVMLAMLLAGCSKSTDVELPLSSTNEEAIKLYRGAQSAWAENNGPKGRDMMEKALSLDPDFILANLNVPTNNPNKWQEYRDKAKLNSANGNDHEKLQVKLWVAAREGRSDDYINLCKELVSKYPNSSEAYVELGNAYTGVENFDLAIENYKKAIDINPNQYRAWRGLASHEVTFGGNTLLPKNRQSKKAALQYAKGMVKARPNAPFSYQAKGNIERQYGDMKAARTQYEKMTEA
ncbi:MAG: tetratricopeptide repeat protein, partial [Candidatus Neomarinimicrobiota bacterium]